MNDTSPAAHRMQTEIYRRMTPQQRLRQAVERTTALRQMARQRVAEQNPDASALRLRWLFALRVLGRTLTFKAYGPCPEQ